MMLRLLIRILILTLMLAPLVHTIIWYTRLPVVSINPDGKCISVINYKGEEADCTTLPTKYIPQLVGY